MAALSTALHGNYIPEIWSKTMESLFYPQLYLTWITNNKREGEIKNYGDTVNIRFEPDVTINDFTPRTDLTIEEITAPDLVQLLIDKGKYYAINADEVEQHQSDVPYIQRAVQRAVTKLKETIEGEFINAIYADAAEGNFGAAAGKKSGAFNLGKVAVSEPSTAAAPVSLTKENAIDWIIDCGTVLDEQNLPNENRWMVLPFAVVNRIKKSEIKEVYITGDKQSSLRTGNIGMIDRFNIIATNQLNKVGDTWQPVFGHKDAISFATQIVKNESSPREKRFGKVYKGLTVYGWKTVHPEALGYSVVKVA